jgi:DNA polymerase epsilon subunit 1
MAPRRGGQPFRRIGKQGQTSYGPRSKNPTVSSTSLLATERTSAQEKFESVRLAHRIDESMGFARYDSGPKRVGWLCNMHSTTVEDEDVPGGKAAVNFYFIGDGDETFKATLEYDPYFLVAVTQGKHAEVEEWIKRVGDGVVKRVTKVEKEDLQMPNHLVGYRRTLLKLEFANVNDLLAVRKVIMPIAEKNKKNVTATDAYAEVAR